MATSDMTSADLLEAKTRGTRLSRVVVLVLVLLGFVVKSYSWFQVPIDQDEFYYLSLVHAFQRGELPHAFQSFHVHLFSWLRYVSENELTQAMAARSVMLLFFLGTCYCLYRIGLRLLGATGALFSVLCYLALIHTVTKGAAFRSDTPATFLFLLALCWFVRKDPSGMSQVVAGAALALACLFTIKAAFYLSAFAALAFILLLGSENRLHALKRMLPLVVTLPFVFLILYRLHVSTLPPATTARAAPFLERAIVTFTSFRFSPKLPALLSTLRWDILTWFLFSLGFGVCAYRLGVRRAGWVSAEAQLLALAAPLLSIPFYRNAFSYFYPFIVPSAMLLCGYGFGVVMSRLEKMNLRLAPVVSVVIAFLVFRTFILWPAALISQGWTAHTAAQREVLSVIHRMFPEPVAYIDGCSMVSSFPKVGFFMSTAGMSAYQREGRAVLSQAIVDRKPLFVLANEAQLNLDCAEPPRSVGAGLTLRPEDWQVLKSHFIHHWGPIWVAGRQFQIGAAAPAQTFEILVAGPYTIEGDAEVVIDGRIQRHGDAVILQEGAHTIEVRGSSATITLRWGRHLYRPKQEPTWKQVFTRPLG